jgi:transposase
LTRVMSRLKAIYRSWAIPCAGQQVYAPRYRAEWLARISEAGVRRRAELYYQQFDALAALRQQARRELLAEARKHPAMRLLRQIPSIGPSAPLCWSLWCQPPIASGPSDNSGPTVDWRWGRTPVGNIALSVANWNAPRRSWPSAGSNINHNHDLKNIFKGAATRAASTAGPFQHFYEACVAGGMKPHLARLTLARKIAAITLLVWKKGVRCDAEHLKQQAA